MRRSGYVLLALAISVLFAGCPIFRGVDELVGQWEWTEPGELVDPTEVSDYDNATVAQNFANNGRVRKTLLFDEEGGFEYIEEAFLPDRQALVRGDKGTGVNWSWRRTYHAVGVFDTARYVPEDRVLSTPGLDTELNVVITEHTETVRIDKRDTDGDRVLDSQLRREFDYITTTGVASDTNPLVLRGLIGMTPFDELMVSWAQHFVGKQLDYNRSHYNNVETYLRVVADEE